MWCCRFGVVKYFEFDDLTYPADTAGQERFQSLGTAFYRGTDGVLLCYDITNRVSLDRIKFWLDELMIRTDNASFPIMLVGTKLDMAKSRQVSKDEAIEVMNKLGLDDYIETSSKDNLNINTLV